MELSWDTVANTGSVKVQFKGGGYTDVWMNAPNLKITDDPWTTTAEFQDLTAWQASGYIYKFRVRVFTGRGLSDMTPWAYVEQPWGYIEQS